MPLYKIEHSYPFTSYQKSELAKRITTLHSTEFTTPSLFVNVNFVPAEPAGDFFLAGKPVGPTPNRIMGTVRTGPKRTKERLDKFAERIEEAWYEVLGGPKEESANGANGYSEAAINPEEKKARKLHIVAFTPVITGRENGVTLPSADNEATWLTNNMAYFEEQAKVHDDEPFQDMLKELQERPDLKKLIS